MGNRTGASLGARAGGAMSAPQARSDLEQRPSPRGLRGGALITAGGVKSAPQAREHPLGPLGFNSPNIAQRHALHVERTAEKAFMLSDPV